MDAQTLTWLYLPVAFGLGMAHALEPGHSKTLVAAYLVSIKGTVRDAVLLGLAVTFSHTIIVFLLAAGVIALGAAVPLDRVQHWLEITSALLVFVMGLWLLSARVSEWRRQRDHSHRHGHHHRHGHQHPHDEHGHGHHDSGNEHGHGHDGHSHGLPAGERLSMAQLLSFGVSGGLVPCPAALAILILAVGAGNPVLGLTTVLVFSIGLGLTLVGIGVAVCRGFAAFENLDGKRAWVQQLPLLSAVVVTVLGLVMLISAFLGHDHEQAG